MTGRTLTHGFMGIVLWYGIFLKRESSAHLLTLTDLEGDATGSFSEILTNIGLALPDNQRSLTGRPRSDTKMETWEIGKKIQK